MSVSVDSGLSVRRRLLPYNINIQFVNVRIMSEGEGFEAELPTITVLLLLPPPHLLPIVFVPEIS